MGDPVDDHPSLATARAGMNKDGPPDSLNGLPLRGIEPS